MRIPHTAKPCGIVRVGPEAEAFLPLERVEVCVDVVDVSALVTVSQYFWQYSPTGISQAKYVFPVPSRAAVCGFEMIAEDGQIITAVVKEREEARREHQAALNQGIMTGLVEHITDDIFSISLGALPGQQMIACKLTYVLDLMEDDTSDQVRLQLPMCIGMRFGTKPSGLLHAQSIHPDRITISVDIRMQGAVKKIVSPTHPTVLVPTHRSTDGIRSVRHSSPDFMVRDFVLIISAEGLDAPRCFAQRTLNGTLAMQLSIVPKFDLPPLPRQEYIFLVDRSGSMGGQRIETAKRALMLLLRSLPSRGTWFNIFSFGTPSDSLWPYSVEYGEQSINQATQHIDGMSANYGGTEMQGALEHVLRTRKADLPSAIFVLTDGETYNIEQTIMPIKIAAQQVTQSAPVRVFALGIGETTSSALCEGMARAGNGVCLMATTTETIIGKCSRLVRASRTYILKNVSIDWGVRTDVTLASQTGPTNPQSLRQAPATVSAIYPGTRFVVFALVENQTFRPPKEVVIRTQRDGQGDLLLFTVPVQPLDFSLANQRQPLIQTLAARRAIMDLDDSVTHSPHRSLIVHLGTQYQLASRFTSFIAVDKRTRAEVRGPLYEAAPEQPIFQARGGLFGSAQLQGNAPPTGSVFGQSAFGATSAFGAAHTRMADGGLFRSGSTAPRMMTLSRPTGFRDHAAAASAFGQPYRQSDSGSPSASLFGSRSVSALQTEYAVEADPMDTTDDGPSPPRAWAAGQQPINDAVEQLILLQSFDGSFPPDHRLLALLGGSVTLSHAQILGISEKIWATCLAVAYLNVHMKGQRELLNSLVEKARIYISRTPDIDVEELFARAKIVVSS